jgi:KDO2-lipid IV(A) lauroyltransferase
MNRSLRRLRDGLGYGAFRSLQAVGSRLPLGLSRVLGRVVVRSLLAASASQRGRARANLEFAFPQSTPQRRRALLGAMARHLGTTLGEIFWLSRASTESVDRLCTISGLEHLEAAREAGRGAVLITAHCGNWELLNARLGTAGVPMTIAVREVYDPRIDAFATSLRRQFGAEVVPRGQNAGRRLVAALVENRVNGLLIDQDIWDIPGVFVPFFGRLAWTPSGAATLALKVGCPVVPAFIHRRPDGSHLAEVHPPLAAVDGGSEAERVQALTAAATAAIEQQVRAHPEQWVWMHRRWKTRPEDNPQR